MIKKVWITLVFLFIFTNVCLHAFASTGFMYQLSWPGILPDNKLYIIKLVRDRLVAKMIINPVDKVRFDLLMADKTIYASKLLLDKGKISLADKTALRGENYFSTLVQDYNNALLHEKKIPRDLDISIDMAVNAHKNVFEYMVSQLQGSDKQTIQTVDKFSTINYQFIIDLRKPKQ